MSSLIIEFNYKFSYNLYSRAQTSNVFKEQYLLQFEQIVENIKQNKLKVENRRHTEKAKRDELNDSYLELIEKQRLYFKGVKDFKDVCLSNLFPSRLTNCFVYWQECKINERLISELETRAQKQKNQIKQ